MTFASNIMCDYLFYFFFVDQNHCKNIKIYKTISINAFSNILEMIVFALEASYKLI